MRHITKIVLILFTLGLFACSGADENIPLIPVPKAGQF